MAAMLDVQTKEASWTPFANIIHHGGDDVT